MTSLTDEGKGHYRFVTGEHDNIEGTVNRLMDLGYKPIGGICVVREGGEYTGSNRFHQAMVRYK